MKERSKSNEMETSLKQGYETLILPPVLISEGLAKGWAIPAQEEVASPFPAAGASDVFGSQCFRSNAFLVYLWNRTVKVAAAKGGAQAESKWQVCVQTRAQMTCTHTCTVPTNILNSSLRKGMLSSCMPLV